MLKDPKDFPALGILADHFDVIRNEYLAVRFSARPWFEANLHNGGWSVYGLRFQGMDLVHECPRTFDIVRQIPGVTSAGFSILDMGAQIKPHVGYSSSVLRCHLGLICPEPDHCWLTVGEARYHWREREIMVFDDTTPHAAQNLGDEDRVVLLIDFERPEGADSRASWCRWCSRPDCADPVHRVRGAQLASQAQTITEDDQ